MGALWVRDRALRACNGSLLASEQPCPDVCGGGVVEPQDCCDGSTYSCRWSPDGGGGFNTGTVSINVDVRLVIREWCLEDTTPGVPGGLVQGVQGRTQIIEDHLNYTGPFDTTNNANSPECAFRSVSVQQANTQTRDGQDYDCQNNTPIPWGPLGDNVTHANVSYNPPGRRLIFNFVSGADFVGGPSNYGISLSFRRGVVSFDLPEECHDSVQLFDFVDQYILSEENACHTSLSVSTNGLQKIREDVFQGVVIREIRAELDAQVVITGAEPCPENIPANPCPFTPPPDPEPTECCDTDGACRPVDASEFPPITLDNLFSRVRYQVDQEWVCSAGPGSPQYPGSASRWIASTLQTSSVQLFPVGLVNACPIYEATLTSGDIPMDGAYFTGCPLSGGFGFTQPASSIVVRHDVKLRYRPGSRFLELLTTLRRVDVNPDNPFADILFVRGLLEASASPPYANSVAQGRHFGNLLTLTMPDQWRINSYESACHTGIDYSGNAVFEPYGVLGIVTRGGTVRDTVTFIFEGRAFLSGIESCDLQALASVAPDEGQMAAIGGLNPAMAKPHGTCPQCPSPKPYSPCRGCSDCGYRPGCNGE